MPPEWEHLYSTLLTDLDRCWQLESPETDRAESCFRVAFNYWHQVKSIFLARVIYSDREEIEFFKEVKPRFTSYIEYYLVMNQGLLFVPPDKTEQLAYWNEESQRYRRFYDRNEEFIQYYDKSITSEDMRYFLARNNHHGLMPQERIYEDYDCRSSHDHLVRGILANRMYRDYVNQKISIIL